MKILVNYLPVYTGGGLQNAMNFWVSCLKYDKSSEWICLTRKGSEIIKLPTDDSHKIIEVELSANYFYRFYKDNIVIKKYADKYGVDLIFTLVGPGPLTNKYPKINGWHEPAFVYPDSIYWHRVDIKSKILQKLKYIYASWVLRKTTYIIVQTQVMKNRMIKYRNIPEEKLFIIPNGITSFYNDFFLSNEKQIIFNDIKNKIKLLVLSEPWLHKNFDYLIDVAKLLDNKYVFVVSFDENTNSVSSNFIAKIRKLNLSNKFSFIGRVQQREIKKIYDNVDCVFLPTLLESFSANYVEAMFYKKPIFTSNLDFAKEVCKDYAFYFDPLKAESGYYEIIQFYETNKKNFFHYSKNEIKLNYPDWKQRFKLYFDIILKIKK